MRIIGGAEVRSWESGVGSWELRVIASHTLKGQRAMVWLPIGHKAMVWPPMAKAIAKAKSQPAVQNKNPMFREIAK